MTDQQLKRQVQALLKELFRLDPEEIPDQQDRRTPDLEVRSPQGDLTILELKAKGDDPSQLALEIEALKEGGIVHRSVPLERRNTLSGIIEEGVEQLRQYEVPTGTFHVLWLHSWGRDAELLRDRFSATLFGSTNLIDLGPTRDTRTGFFFHFNDFFRFRDILDGAIISVETGCQLCINSLSPRADEFRKSGFVTAFAKGLCDPKVLEERGEAYIVDCDLDRRNTHDVLKYVRKKYGKERLLDLNLTMHSGTMAVPDPDPK
jgi:hypothetical protein